MKYILGIETSCDETSAAVVTTDWQVKGQFIATQIATHQDYGGVIPEIASRMHVEAINPVIEQALSQAGITIKDVAAIAVTYGPGLLGALLIGLQAAKTLCYLHQLPLIGVNHMEGHIMANFLDGRIPFNSEPFLCLVVSGGHTQLVVVSAPGNYKIIGTTVDDAVGEVYDKVARLLQLGYPGGPVIDKVAKTGNANAIVFSQARLKGEGSEFNFSFSGLKTAVINYYRQHPQTAVADLCASFQKTAVNSLVEKTVAAAKAHGLKKIFLAGGVSANSALRQAFDEVAKKEGFVVSYPPLKYCTDNAAMIAAAAIIKFNKQEFAALDLKANPNLILN